MAVKTPWTSWKQKVCCTCEYWDGEREIEFRNSQLWAVQAQCNPQGRCKARYNCSMSFSNSAQYCKTYKRWHLLPE